MLVVLVIFSVKIKMTDEASPIPEVVGVATSTPEIATTTISVHKTFLPHIVISTTEVEKIVRERWKDIPVLIEIARCESHFNMFNANGTVFRGRQNPSDVGVMMINEHYHTRNRKMDFYTLEGNLEYAEFLYKTEGTTPWNWSKFCWNS